MRVLFITRVYPYPPRTGALQYSARLIERLAENFSTLDVVCEQGAGELSGSNSKDNIKYHLFKGNGKNDVRKVFSRLPHAAAGYQGAGSSKSLRSALTNCPDCVVIDHVGSIWAASLLPSDLPKIYVTHNDEFLTRLSIARSAGFLRAGVHYFDALKIYFSERWFSGVFSCITAISRRDMKSLERRLPRAEFKYLPPIYDVAMCRPVEINVNTPRSIVLLGSLLWEAKRQNLISFLGKNESALSKANIGIIVAGRVQPSFIEDMKKKYPSVTFMGEVANERDVLGEARIGILYGESGGGFRITSLTFSNLGVPIISRKELVEDLCLENGESYFQVETDSDIADKVIELIDSVENLREVGGRGRIRAERFINENISRAAQVVNSCINQPHQ